MMSFQKKSSAPLLAASANIVPIAADPRYTAVAQQLDALETAWRAAEERLRQAKAARVAGAGRAALHGVTGEALAAGTRVPSGVTPEGEIAAAEAEFVALQPDLAKANAALDDIKGTLSHELCYRFRDLNSAAHRKMLEAMIGFAEAYNEIADLHARLLAAGYSINHSAIPWQIPANPLPIVGLYQHRPDGPIEVLRRFVEEKL